jgi:hypothetical protein
MEKGKRQMERGDGEMYGIRKLQKAEDEEL